MRRRVAITGLGAVSSLGVGAGALWDGLASGRVALRRPARFNPDAFPSRLAGEVADFSARDYMPKQYRKAVKVMARDIELAVVAAKCAVEDAGLITRGTLADGAETPTTYPADRVGCQIGAGIIAAETDELTAALVNARRPGASATDPSGGFELRQWGAAEGPDGVKGAGHINSLTPLWLLKYLPNMLSCHVTIIHGCEGPSNTITCAEASGLLSIGESVHVIERDAADMCFSGGAESKVNYMGLLRLTWARRLASTDGVADAASIIRPYDKDASGTITGEAAGLVILEEEESARRRGAPMYALVRGFGAGHGGPDHLYTDCGDRPSVTSADEGLQLAIERALRDSGVRPEEIDAIIPGASGIPSIDAGEAGALRAVFGARLGEIELVTVTPNIGQSVAGHGAVLAVVAAQCVRKQAIPARVHAGTPAAGLRAGASPSRPMKLRNVLVCCSALGGQAAAIVLGAP